MLTDPEESKSDPVRERSECPDCRAAKRHAYSDMTTPGFFFPYCDKHKPGSRISEASTESVSGGSEEKS